MPAGTCAKNIRCVTGYIPTENFHQELPPKRACEPSRARKQAARVSKRKSKPSRARKQAEPSRAREQAEKQAEPRA